MLDMMNPSIEPNSQDDPVQQRAMLAKILASRRVPQGGGWANGLTSGIQNGLQMWLLGVGGGERSSRPGGFDPVMGRGRPANVPVTDYANALQYLRP